MSDSTPINESIRPTDNNSDSDNGIGENISMKNPSVFTSGEKKIAGYEGMCKYVMCGDQVDPIEQYKLEILNKVQSAAKDTKDLSETLTVYQMCLNNEFGVGVGDRFVEMFQKHSQKITVPHPYCYFAAPNELEIIKFRLFFDDCLNQLIRLKELAQKKHENTLLIQNLLARVKFLEKESGLSHHLQAN
jgi:hypothetical protein